MLPIIIVMKIGDKAINKELGHNWKTTNYSQEPDKSAKFDKLVDRCK